MVPMEPYQYNLLLKRVVPYPYPYDCNCIKLADPIHLIEILLYMFRPHYNAEETCSYIAGNRSNSTSIPSNGQY